MPGGRIIFQRTAMSGPAGGGVGPCDANAADRDRTS